VRTAVGCAALLLIGGGVAYATGTIGPFVGPDGTISACVQKDSGDVRIVAPGHSCRARDEVSVKWNQHGIQGPKGDIGPSGPPGASPGPANVSVDCAAGQSVQQALDANANATSVNITINGTCTESVNVDRDNVSLSAGAAGGLTSPMSGAPVIQVEGRQVQIQGLAIAGGTGVSVNGGWLQATDVNISGGSAAVTVDGGGGGNASVFNSSLSGTQNVVDAGPGGAVQLGGDNVQGSSGGFDISVSAGGTVSVGQSTISGGRDGVIANPGGSAQLFNTTVSDTAENGLFAFGGSIVDSGGSITGSGGAGVSTYAGGYADLSSGVRIANDNIGVSTYGGRILLQAGVVIENNTGDGVQVSSSSSVAAEGPVTIQNNSGNGVHIQDNSVASFGSGDQITGNGGLGIFCDSSPANPLIVGPPAPAGVTTNCNHG